MPEAEVPFAPPAAQLAARGVPLGPLPRPPLIPGPFTVEQAAASANVTVTATASPGTDITGATLKVRVAGLYLVFAVFDFLTTAVGFGTLVGELNVDGVVQTGQALMQEAAARATVAQTWVVSITRPDVVIMKLAAWKTINAGTATVQATHTTIKAMRVPV